MLVDRCLLSSRQLHVVRFFFFNDTATTEIYTLSLHDALPDLICSHFCVIIKTQKSKAMKFMLKMLPVLALFLATTDRKSTRLNSSHTVISYAVFCLKKKKHKSHIPPPLHTPQYHITPYTPSLTISLITLSPYLSQHQS